MASTNLENNLRIGHINVRSLIPSLNEIKSSIDNLKLDILGVTESWLTEQVVDCDNVNQKTAILSDVILTLFDSHAPICEKKVTRPPSPWFTDALHAMKNHRNYLFSKYKRNKNLRDWASYKEMRNFFTSAVRQEKRAYIDFISRTKKSKDMWKTLDQLNIYNRSKKNIEIPNHLKNPNLINQYFIDSVRQIPSTVDTNTISKYLNSKCTTAEFELKLVSEDGVFWAISEIGSNASGADGISLDMLKRERDTYIVRVKARITPENRVKSKPYHCSFECDEKEETVIKLQCSGCAAQEGGCKHGVALFMWLHRRSEEPPCTSVKCYWTNARLSLLLAVI
ncbi:unnamed protein product [Acanthoscelides obtectus]|uniref:Uncharacterized protein n=1 Tax=Acanthoscelides obtectus TaxID=200917 RepID=A0A9P0LAF2_ACAOB|nr:unnamed protein product [Acanthoscelides obtectus]CAK1684071.1 hypothetical protein AOBTE_LOCUS34601 [Acanthoscelides obtectus]